MIRNVIDLTSSSPLPFKPALPKHAPPPSAQHRSAAPLSGLDSFDDVDDFGDVLDLTCQPESKRRKVHGQHDAVQGKAKMLSIAEQPPFMVGNPLNKRSALETIEFTSSLEPTSPTQGSLDARKTSSSHHLPSLADDRTTTACELEVSCTSDPFDSSPRVASANRANCRRAQSLDPFCSSSPLRVAVPRDHLSETKFERPIGAGRLLSQRDVQTGRQHGEAHPFADSRTAVLPTETKVSDQVIHIDDSDISSDDELPSIREINMSRRHARSTLRRSQSDVTWSRQRALSSVPRLKQTKPKKLTEERVAEKEEKRREREEQRAVKALEKQRAAALVEVNKLRTDKKVSTPEMIVDLPSSLKPELQVQIQEMLQGLGVQHSTWDCPDHNIIKWRRTVSSKFNDNLGLWEPIPARVVEESTALVILTADEFVETTLDGTLSSVVMDVQTRLQGKSVLYLIQGLTAWLRKNRNNRNRSFAARVRSINAKTTLRVSTEYISEDIVEDALLTLQVDHDMLIHHTAVATETARWVVNFTQHVSTIPYKNQRDQATSVAGFCMESGQVRTGDSPHDTYVRMLQEIVRVTAPTAYGVASEFETVTKLIQGLERGGPNCLEGVRRSANKDGAVTDRTIGGAVSRRIFKVFIGKDEESTDV
ncbi:hypothetical protein UVI_02052200 [Ustilaginoidea virens]|uniref:Uncharacterized protein n=1 Tax=Ustilaginoidea virens TaxID=1159556 RepID=A0A063BLW9_USTVR|nr:hypothetical protein UVI_02052200 [Ustilaginoidea virens]